MKKVCTGCHKLKPESEFYSNYKTSDKKASQCKRCSYEAGKVWRKNNREKYNADCLRQYHANPEPSRIRSRKYRYGITKDGFEKLNKQQNGVCAICKRKDNKLIHLSVDHCHVTGKIRGLLCGNCNKGIGYFKDSPERLLEAAKYLQK